MYMLALIFLTFGAALISMPLYSGLHALFSENSRAREVWDSIVEADEVVPMIVMVCIALFLLSIAMSADALTHFSLGPVTGVMFYLLAYCGFGFYDASQAKWQYFLPVWLANRLKTEKQKVASEWDNLFPAEIKEAKQVSKRLLKMLKGRKHREQFKAVVAKLQKLVEEEMPRLLDNEKQLIELVAAAEETIKKEKANGIMAGEEQLMRESERDLATLKQRQADTKNKIQLIICFLNHFSIRLSVLVSTDSTEEVKRSLFEVQQDLDQMLKADEEIAELQGKYVNDEIAAQTAAIAEVNQVTEKLRQPPKVAAG
jgi:ParB-like chromosome segregation protein Spo0J